MDNQEFNNLSVYPILEFTEGFQIRPPISPSIPVRHEPGDYYLPVSTNEAIPSERQ